MLVNISYCSQSEVTEDSLCIFHLLYFYNDMIFVGQAKIHFPHFRQSECR